MRSYGFFILNKFIQPYGCKFITIFQFYVIIEVDMFWSKQIHAYYQS